MGEEHLLQNVAEDQSFWVNNGPIVGSLPELSLALKEISKEQFSHHVTSEKNDFATWVNDVVGDNKLAAKLAKARTAKAAHRIVHHRVEHIEQH